MTEVKHGVAIEKFGEFAGWLAENPERGQLTLEARVVYEGTVGRSLAHIGPYALDGQRIERETRRYTIPFGAWKEVEAQAGYRDPTDRMEPVETTLAALAACLNVAVSLGALREGLELEGLETRVEAEVDPRVLFGVKGLEESPACLRTLRAQIRVQGDLSDRGLRLIGELAKRSPVHTLISERNEVLLDVKRG